MSLMIKICGMREPDNILKVANLEPDLMGFIFYPASLRYVSLTSDPDIFEGIPAGIRKAGVFVNTGSDMLIRTIRKFSLDIVQLHGNETPEICRQMKQEGVQVIKTFNIKAGEDFKLCSDYISCTDYFLFDSLTSGYGGSGKKFNWKLLDSYEQDHPFFLSGGIAPGDADAILKINNPAFYGIDVNSKFEVRPGVKDLEMLKEFICNIRNNNKSL